MMKKCNGCGAVIQFNDQSLEGYVKEENYLKSNICERCFRIKNYGDYKRIDKDNNNFIEILKKIDDTHDLVVLIVDIFSINKDILDITKYLNNDILLVFTKRDILPKSINDERLLNYKERLGIKTIDSLIVSSNKNYNLDLLYEKINKYKKSNNVYVIGYTNAGKSTLINKMIYNYSKLNSDITTSILPSTTLDTIEIKLNDSLTLIDTPGILDDGNIINYITENTLKKIMPKNEIKPITYQIKSKQFIVIDKILKIEAEKNNLTFFISNQLKVERFYKYKPTILKENIVRIKKNQDIVISGLGFIKSTNNGIVKVYTLDGVKVYTRDSLV